MTNSLHPSNPEIVKPFLHAGIIGALDPYTHKVNTASLSGEGKLELEGVRPLRTNSAAVANIAASIMAGAVLAPIASKL